MLFSVKAMEADNILKACLLETKLPGKRDGRRTKMTVQTSATALQQKLEEWTYSDPQRLAQAKSGD